MLTARGRQPSFAATFGKGSRYGIRYQLLMVKISGDTLVMKRQMEMTNRAEAWLPGPLFRRSAVLLLGVSEQDSQIARQQIQVLDQVQVLQFADSFGWEILNWRTTEQQRCLILREFRPNLNPAP